jgi:hypothetical protein
MGIASKLDVHLAGSSFLFWKINLLKQSLNVTMHAGWADFPHDVAKMMKDPAYREAILRKDDLDGLNQALATIRKGQSAQVVFHIKSSDTLTHWCLLVGNAQQGVADEIYGSLICVEMPLVAKAADPTFNRSNGLPAGKKKAGRDLPESRLESLRRELARSDDLYQWLDIICRWEQSDLFEALLFSDVQQARGKVLVYGAGDAFADLHEGRHYPYEGTIAEMIVSLNLDHVVVDDTMESLKPIDWALFVPHGIRSYFAIPAFEAGIIRGVLIFCSSKANHFSEEYQDYFSRIADVMFSAKDLFEKIET